MAAPRKYPPELRAHAVALWRESNRPIAHIAAELGIHREALRGWIRQERADRKELGPNGPLTSEERDELKRLRRDVGELRRANEILKAASAYFATELDPTRRRS